MSTLEIIGLVATSLSILGVIIGVAVKLSSFPAERKITGLETENEKLRLKLEDLANNQAKLVETLTLVKTASTDAQALKSEIDQELHLLAQMVGVESASILVPYPASRNTRFAFLSIAGPESSKLKNTLLDINKGIAGQVFSSGLAKIVINPQSNNNWNNTVDKRIAFQTKNLLCIPLRNGNTIVGVAQFLNKAEDFSEQDRTAVEKTSLTLAYKVDKFVQRIENFEILGLAFNQNLNDGGVIFFDLTASSSLLKGAHPLPLTDVINLINEYLDRLTTLAIQNNFIIDKYMWDGCLLSANVIKPVPDYPLVAYRTALSMQNSYEDLKASWLRAELPVENLYCRIAITCGPVTQVDMGPAQYRQKTIVGDAVVTASALCANATRKKNVIIVDQNTYDVIRSDHIVATKVPESEMGKAKELIKAAYQISLNNQGRM